MPNMAKIIGTLEELLTSFFKIIRKIFLLFRHMAQTAHSEHGAV
jgi:hypothetical protein